MTTFTNDLGRGMVIGFKLAVSVYGLAGITLLSLSSLVGMFAAPTIIAGFLDMVWDAK